MMIATPTSLHWLYSALATSPTLDNNHGIWITIGLMCGNLGEGLALCGCTAYLSLQCKALKSGHLFGIFFLSQSFSELMFVILDMEYQGASDSKNYTIFYWILALSILASFVWLMMDKEKTHHLEEKWHLEEVQWQEIFVNTVWCIGFFACAESFGWAANFL